MTNDYWKLPANSEQLRDAVEWAAGGELSLQIDAPSYVVAELLEQKENNKLLLHLVNFNVTRVPVVRGINVDLRNPTNFVPKTIILMTAAQGESVALPFHVENARTKFTVPELGAYALIVIQ